jgi:hypothetical protein
MLRDRILTATNHTFIERGDTFNALLKAGSQLNLAKFNENTFDIPILSQFLGSGTSTVLREFVPWLQRAAVKDNFLKGILEDLDEAAVSKLVCEMSTMRATIVDYQKKRRSYTVTSNSVVNENMGFFS